MAQHQLLEPSFDLYALRATVFIAAVASYAALTLVGRVGAREGREHVAWVGWGGSALGLGIAAMHFVGMLSMQLPVEVSYESGRTVLSVLFAIAACTLALDIAGDQTLGFKRLAFGSLLFGGAVAGMHYIGVSAIRAPVVIDQQPARVIVSVLIAISTGAGALYLAFRLRDGTGASAGAQRIAGAVILGMAIAGMHFTAMSAMQFHATPTARPLATSLDGPLFSGRGASVLIATASFLVLVGAVVSAFIDQSARRAFRETQLSLEQQIAEREAEAEMAIEQLARSEARFRAAADGSFDAFFVLEAERDAAGHIVDFVYSELNMRGEALIGRTRSDVLGRRMSEVFPATANADTEKLAHVVHSGQPHQEEIEHANASHPVRWFHRQIVPLGDGVAVTARDVTERKHQEEELRALTLVDDLTGLYNRRGFRMLAEQHLRLVKRGGPVSLLVCFDLDDFKYVNDLYGHAEGDAALRRTASILRTAFRDSDIIARFGGDEFVVLALDCGEMRERLLGRVDAAVDAHNEAAARPYSLSLSLGTAQLDPFAPISLDALMAEADTNLYEAKRRRMAREMMA
jgi:diguanylate cyclase (GGDEF)-like protein/PAS domain S-box-containing protein